MPSIRHCGLDPQSIAVMDEVAGQARNDELFGGEECSN